MSDYFDRGPMGPPLPRPCPCPYCARKRSRRTGPPAIATAAWWLGRGLRRLAGIDPFPNDERRN